MSVEINQLLRLYLGADENGGYQPIGCDARMIKAFPFAHKNKMKLIARYLAEDHVPDWSKHDLIQERDLFAFALGKKFPELDEIVVRALANRFTFDYR